MHFLPPTTDILGFSLPLHIRQSKKDVALFGFTFTVESIIKQHALYVKEQKGFTSAFQKDLGRSQLLHLFHAALLLITRCVLVVDATKKQ